MKDRNKQRNHFQCKYFLVVTIATTRCRTCVNICSRSILSVQKKKSIYCGDFLQLLSLQPSHLDGGQCEESKLTQAQCFSVSISTKRGCSSPNLITERNVMSAYVFGGWWWLCRWSGVLWWHTGPQCSWCSAWGWTAGAPACCPRQGTCQLSLENSRETADHLQGQGKTLHFPFRGFQHCYMFCFLFFSVKLIVFRTFCLNNMIYQVTTLPCFFCIYQSAHWSTM